MPNLSACIEYKGQPLEIGSSAAGADETNVPLPNTLPPQMEVIELELS